MKTINKIIAITILGILGVTQAVFSAPRYSYGNNNGGDHPNIIHSSSITVQQVFLDGNNIESYFMNSGVFDQDFRVANTPGFMWPKGSGKHACFTAGLSMGCFINGQLREAMNSYKGELAPGYVELVAGVPTGKTDGRFRIYRVKNPDNNSNPDYAQWGDMVPYGAPYDDVNQNNQYDPGVDIPGRKDASMTLFACLTDGFPAEHKVGEGFGGGTPPMFAEYHFTAWCYNSPGLTNLQFINWVVINKNIFAWEKLYMGVTVDPDLGFADDDYIGCDTSKDMGFCYNADNDDAGSPYAYGSSPPAFGMDYFTSPVNRNVNPPDTLGLTSFVYFTNTSTPGPACEQDPNGEAVPAYYMLKGLKKDQTPWVVPNTNPPEVTKYCYPGDPQTGTGWTEGTPGGDITGRVFNCGGLLTGTLEPICAPGDRRFIFNSGAENFTMQPGEQQSITLAQFVARGNSNFNSVTQLKRVDDVAQKIFDLNFQVIPPPPPPVVTQSFRKVNDNSNVELTLSWGDVSEYYNYQDTIFVPPDSNSFYRFEGYMVFEVKNSAEQLPDFTDPTTDISGIRLLAIYDKKNNIGFLTDTFKVGSRIEIDTNGIPHIVDLYSVLNVVPPNRMAAPQGFPNSGLRRRITINSTSYPEEHGGNTGLIYGHTYKFIVIAYAYNTHPSFMGMAMNSNSLDAGLMVITPQQSLAGTQYFYKNGDTLSTSKRDLGVMPIVMAQENLQEAKYRVLFSSPDTTYSILRSYNGGQTFDLLKANLKYTNYGLSNNTIADDSARVIDGILFKVQKIRFTIATSPPGSYFGNVGVIKDPLFSRDSIQTRYYGWDYLPAEHNPYDSTNYKPGNRAWQSKSMSISYPNRNTYVGFKSLLNPEDLRKVKIVFTGYGQGQQAYRYLAVTGANYQYQDMREVPFKIYEIDIFDGTPKERQVNCAFLEFPDGAPNEKWEPTADSLGGKEVLYIFSSDYNAKPISPYTTTNLILGQATIDVMYVWAPRLKTSNANFTIGDQFIIYPYTVTRPNVVSSFPLYYDIDTKSPLTGNSEIASQNNDLDKVRVVPNPYYGGSTLETSISGRFITFTRLPKECTIKVYTLNGDLIKTFQKNDNNSTLQWNMTNLENVPIASGMYIALVDAPGIGQKILKMAIFTPEERLDF